MALAIVEVLVAHGRIEQDALALRFLERYRDDPLRGYGKMTRMTLESIDDGVSWQTASMSAFSGTGSMGNGAAMRVAPLGAFFAEDLENVVRQATASAVVTHTHPEGIAGSIAVAVAAASVCRNRNLPVNRLRATVFSDVLDKTPPSLTRDGIHTAMSLPNSTPAHEAASQLGRGFLVTSQDTVPFALWAALRHADDYAQALATTVSVDGDCDTNCAIVGGIVALYSDPPSIPASWRGLRERWSIRGLDQIS